MNKLFLLIGAIALTLALLLIADCSSPVAGGATDSPNSYTAKIEGRVVYGDRSAVAGARVTLRPAGYLAEPAGAAADGRTGADTATDAQGFFAIDSIDTGIYFLEINDRGGRAVGITLPLYRDTALGESTLEKVVKIGGVVTLQGAPQALVVIRVRGFERYIVADTLTGAFSIPDLPSGPYTLQVAALSPDFPSVEVSVPRVAPGDSVSVNSITLNPFASEDYAAWAHSKRLVVNTTAGGAEVAESEARFPLLVRLDSTVFNFGEALPGGADIRFATVAGRKLRYEIEMWDHTAGQAAVWVLVDTIRALDTTELIMYWGRSGAADFSNGAAVFDTADGFAGVWHMRLDNGLVRDATAMRNHGTPVRFNGDEVVAGCIGKALSADQSRNYVVVSDKPELRMSRAITISAWIHGRGYGRIISSGIRGAGNNYQLYCAHAAYKPEFAVGIDSANSFYSSGSASPDSSAWNYVAAVYNGNEFSFRTNGVHSVSGMTWNGPVTAVAAPLAFFSIPEGGENLALPLDEIRIEQTVRSPAWLKLCYENQRSGQVLVRFR